MLKDIPRPGQQIVIFSPQHNKGAKPTIHTISRVDGRLIETTNHKQYGMDYITWMPVQDLINFVDGK